MVVEVVVVLVVVVAPNWRPALQMAKIHHSTMVVVVVMTDLRVDDIVEPISPHVAQVSGGLLSAWPGTCSLAP